MVCAFMLPKEGRGTQYLFITFSFWLHSTCYQINYTIHGDGTWAPPVPGSDGHIATTHSGKGNFAFADGHVKALKPSATVDADPNKYSNTGCYSGFFFMWDATRTQ
jgi:prepilin-type processing-associated H-X9-DG protein